MDKKRIFQLARWLFVAMLFTLLFPLGSVFAQAGPLQPVSRFPLYGNFCTAVSGVSLNDAPYDGIFTLDVPGVPVRAAWMWSGRSSENPQLGDSDIIVEANSNSNTIIASQSLSHIDGGRTWYTYLYDDLDLTTVQIGLNSYAVSGLSINTLNLENHGAAVVVVYEGADCPFQRIELDWGLDSFRNSLIAPPDSEVFCKTFPADTIERTLTVDMIVGGIENDRRGNAIWTITGDGALPIGNITPDGNNNPFPGATKIDDPLNNNKGEELDIYSLPINVAADDTYACFQIESKITEVDPYGISAVLFGAVTSWPMEAPAIDIQKSPDLQTVVSGSTVSFTLRVENTGPITLTDVQVRDQLSSNCDVNLGTMAPGAEKIYDCSLASVTRGFTNTASVTGQPPYGKTISDADEAIVEVINPAIDIQKTPDTQTILAGAPITFTISVKNTGDITLTHVAITDSLAPTCDASLGTMAPHETQAYTCILDVATQSFTNMAVATGLPPVGPVVSDTDSADVTVITPAITIAKSPYTQTVEKGDTVVFDITVENRGDVDLSNVTVTDALTPNCDRVIGTLAVNKNHTYQCSLHPATESFTNVATVIGQTEIGSKVSHNDSANVVVIGPAIDIQKTPDLQTVPSGSDVTFNITVANTGDVGLTNVTITDTITPNCNIVVGTLAAGESTTYSCTMVNVTDNLTNLAKVSGNSPLGTMVKDEDSASVETANIEIQKRPDIQTVVAGSDVTFTIKIINTGNVVLTNIAVMDSLAPQCNATIGTLQPGASHSYDCKMSAIQDSLVNIASVTGDLPTGANVEDDASAVVDVIHPSIVISKTPDLQTVIVGSTVDFTIRVMNNGDVDLAHVNVTDPQVPTCNNVIGELAIGAFAEYTCQLNSATVDFTNTAMVSGTPPVGPNVSNEDNAEVDVISPELTIEKLPDMQMVRANGTAHFTIVVKNMGDTPLFEVDVKDSLAADCNRRLGDLRPGDTRIYICEAPNIVADFTNVANVIGNTALNTQLTDSDNAVVDMVSPAINLTKMAVNKSIGLGETAEFTIRVENSGDVPLNDVKISDQIAPQCARELGTLNKGDVREYTCEMPNIRETVTNVATVTGKPPIGPDVIDEDNARVEVPQARMTISKKDDQDVVQPGGVIKYTLTYANQGPGDAFDVVLIEIVPSYTTFDATGSSPGWVCEEGRVSAGTACRFEVGNLPANSEGQPVTFIVQIDNVVPKGVNKIINQVTVDGVNLVPAGGSNIATKETPMQATALETSDEPGVFIGPSIRFGYFYYLPYSN